MGGISAEDKGLYALVDTGFIGQNVYPFCSLGGGLATVFARRFETLRFSALSGVSAMIETVPLEGAADAYAKCCPPIKPQRTRDAHYCTPPAQIRTSPIRASGSYLGCLTAKR